MRRNTLKSLRIQNLLSFGDDSPEIELGNLNVLIGPNGSGKSNLIEIIGLLRSTPKDFAAEIGDSGGVSEWLWKGKSKSKTTTAKILAKTELAGVSKPVSYQLAFSRVSSQLKIVDERIESVAPDEGHENPTFYYRFNAGRPILKVLNIVGYSKPRSRNSAEFDAEKSILSQRQDPGQYPEVTYLGRFFGSFRLYRNWSFGPESGVRDLYGSGQKTDFLEEDTSNLALMINKLRSDPEVNAELLRHLRMFYAGAKDIHTPIQGGLVDLRIEEENGISIPASRLSDGTLRWLTLLSILLHPEPPPLVCIEEPELGLHPDMIQPLAKLLLSAADRMQLIITTHSDDLVDEMSDSPGAVIVCEKNSGSSILRRLDGGILADWLKRYRLGQLWRTGEIGGNRW